AFPPNFNFFVIYRIIGGLGVGAASMTSPMYIAEISPARIRGRMVSVNQLAIVFGMLVVYFVNYFIGAYGTSEDRPIVEKYVAQHGTSVNSHVASKLAAKHYARIESREFDEFLAKHGDRVDSQRVVEFLAEHELKIDKLNVHLENQGVEPWNERRGWRLMFGSESLPALLLLVLMFCVPESPRWLAKQKRREEALVVLSRVGGSQHANKELADIEGAIAQESGSLIQLLRPGMRIVLLIGVALAVLQQVTGINVFLYYAPEIFKSMGKTADAALLQAVFVGAVMLTFTIIAIWTVDRLGRKPLMLIGFTGMGFSLVAWGLVFYCQTDAPWVLVFVFSYIACFALSVGPVTWVILSEIFPTRIRGRAMAIATVCLWLANYVVTQTFTIMERNQWLVERFHRGFPYWVYAAFCAVSVLFVWRLLPETKGKTLEEIERSWTR
ncbi:MAG: sugar porter family MFS transporter, partial [Planctomycetota bacterium]